MEGHVCTDKGCGTIKQLRSVAVVLTCTYCADQNIALITIHHVCDTCPVQ